MIKLKYKYKIFLYFLLLFSLFMVVITVFQQRHERKYKSNALEHSLNDYADIINNYLINSGENWQEDNFEKFKELLSVFPNKLRVTLTNEEGDVIFDNRIKAGASIENHINRPEFQSASFHESGRAIRKSETTGEEYFYFVKYYKPHFIRVALPYDVEVVSFLHADNIFLYFMLLLFAICMVSILYLADKVGRSISRLKDFLIAINTGDKNFRKIDFPETETGEIGKQIVKTYEKLEESNVKIKLEQDKLVQHFTLSEEGIAIFSNLEILIYANTHFVQYVNLFLDTPTFSMDGILYAPEFQFIKQKLDEELVRVKEYGRTLVSEFKTKKAGKTFVIKLLVFPDKSFEIIIQNYTKIEKNKLLKHEMTNNIAHELRTPVSSIRGYIETLLSNTEITDEKKKWFLERSFSQLKRLSNLIKDISLITKIEEASEMFQIDKFDLTSVVNDIQEELKYTLDEGNLTMTNNLPANLMMSGSKTLIYSLFRNLFDNAIKYSGPESEICLDLVSEDNSYYYFSFYDTGQGVEKKHLERLFERFYRVNHGRSRSDGGSGLGLSIVKNAVLFHKGQIIAKNRKEGGLQFLFSLKKEEPEMLII